MRLRLLVVAPAFFSATLLVLFFALSLFFDEMTIFLLAIPCALTVFFFFTSLGSGESKNVMRLSIPNLVPVSLALLCLALVLFIPDNGGSALEWAEVPLLSWLRLAASVLLTTFLPGYFLLRILVRKNALSTGICIVLSYLVSIFIVFLAGFLILLTGNSIASVGEEVMIGITVTIMTARIIELLMLRHGSTKGNSIVTFNWRTTGLLFSVLAVGIFGNLAVMVANTPLTVGDMQLHHGIALQYLNAFPAYGGKLVPPYPYLFHIFLAVLFSISGSPTALTEQSLFVLNFMPLLALFSVASIWFKERTKWKMASITVAFSTLLGFGGFYAFLLGLVQSNLGLTKLLSVSTLKTYDIYMRVLFLPDIVAPMWVVGLPAFLALLYLLKDGTFGIPRSLLVVVLVITGYLGHVVEMFFFTMSLLLFLLLTKPSHGRSITLSVLTGLIIVGLIDLVAPASIYVTASSAAFFGLSPVYAVSLVLAALSLFIGVAREKHLIVGVKKLGTQLHRVLVRFGYSLKWLLLYLYVFSTVAWLAVQTDFNLWEWGGYNVTPFFVLPIRLGTVGILSVVTVLAYSSDISTDRNLIFFVTLAGIGFVLEQFAGALPLFYPAYRFATLTFVGACVLSAYCLVKFVSRSSSGSIRRQTAVFTLVFLLITLGLLGTTLYYVNGSYYSKDWSLSKEEEIGLQYVRKNLSNNASVLTFSEDSSLKLRDFAGVNDVQNAYRWSQLMLSTTDPNVMVHVFGESNIELVYLTRIDTKILEANDVLTVFVSYFPQVFNNDYVVIHHVDTLIPPSENAPLGVLRYVPEPQETEIDWIDDSFTQGWSLFRQYGNIGSYETRTENGRLEMSLVSNQSGNVWVSYSFSDVPMNVKPYSALFVRYRVENSFSWLSIQLWNSSNQVFYHVRARFTQGFTTESYHLPENETVSRVEIIVETSDEAPAGLAARVYLDYIRLSKVAQSWRDDNFKRDWAFYDEYGEIQQYNASSDGQTFAMSVMSNQSGNVWVSYSVPLALQTNNSLLSFRYRVRNSLSWFTVKLWNSSDQGFFYMGHLTDSDFTRRSFQLPDGESVSRIEILVETPQDAPLGTYAMAEIDYIEIASSVNPFSRQEVLPSLFMSLLHSEYSIIYVHEGMLQDLSNIIANQTCMVLTSNLPRGSEELLSWVSHGKQLLILNMDRDHPVLDSFAPNSFDSHLIRQDYGSGRIIWVNSLIQNGTHTETELVQPHFLEEVRTAADLSYSGHSTSVLPVYNSALGDIRVRGNVTICTDALYIQGSISPVNSSLFSNSDRFRAYGRVTLTMTSCSLLVQAGYSRTAFKPEDSVEGIFQIDGPESSIMSDGSAVTINDTASFHFSTDQPLFTGLCSLSTSGIMDSDLLDVHEALYVPLAGIVQGGAEIQGVVKFDSLYVSDPLFIFTTFHVEGNVRNLDADPIRGIQWVDILTSPINLAFNCSFLIAVGVHYIRRRTKRPVQLLQL